MNSPYPIQARAKVEVIAASQSALAIETADYTTPARAVAQKVAGRFVVLDSWRGVCALMVAFYHFPFVGRAFWVPILRNAYLFVDFFFVLSGFVICHAYSRKIATASDAGGFMIRRIGRVWPLHAAVLAAFVMLETVRQIIQHDGFGPSRNFSSLIDNLLLVHSWGFASTLTWNGPSWSISVEFALYIMFALVAWLAPRRFVPVSAAAALAGIVIVALWAPSYVEATVHYGVARGLAGFFTGVLVHRLIEAWRPDITTATELMMLGVVAFFVVFAGSAEWVPLFAPLVFGAVVFVFASESGAVSNAMSGRVALALGTWSYSIYMVHMLVISLCKGIATHSSLFSTHLEGTTTVFSIDPMWICDLMAVLYLVVVVALSAMTYRFIEAPSRAFFNGLAGRKSKTLNPAAA